MRQGDGPLPVRMQRIALVAPADAAAAMLEQVGDLGIVELEPAATLPTRTAELDHRAAQLVRRGPVAALAGWVPAAELPRLAAGLAPLGAAAVVLPPPRGVQPPTLLPARRARSFDPLVRTYAIVPYSDVDPTLIAGLAYVAMFGMMFGDIGHGMLLLLGGLVVRYGRIPRLRRLRPAWPFLAGAGVTSMVFGLLYGEMFGPTGLVPVLWLSPIDEPIPLLLTALAAGAVLLAGAYALGTVNRFREAGWRYALYAPTGIAGSGLFLAAGMIAAGVYTGQPVLTAAGAVLAALALSLAFAGLLASSGRGVAGVLQAVVELFDVVVRLLSNVVSFARLAAFGLAHAALGAVVWDATTGLWGGARSVAAVLVFLVGNLIAFTLEALVAAIQALRLEYYELFSRIFGPEGRPFRPWRLPPAEAVDHLEVRP